MTCALAKAFDMLRQLENIDARHHFTCCQRCGVDQMQGLEDERDEIVGYCFYHAEDAENIERRKELFLSYGGYETPTECWSSEDVAHVVVTRLSDCGIGCEWDQDDSTRIKALLDDESIDYVAAWSDGFEGGRRVSYDWKFFDFDEHWETFASYWYSDRVQSVLKESIERLGIDKDLRVGNAFVEDVYRKPWKKGDALWQLSPNYHSYIQIGEDALEGPENPHSAYNRTMKHVNSILCMSEGMFMRSGLGVRAVYELASRRKHVGSLVYTNERLIACADLNSDLYQCFISGMAGRAVLHDALSMVAEEMFKSSVVADVYNPQDSVIVTVVDRDIVFDLVGYYFYNHKKWSGAAVENIVELFHLNQMKSKIDV